LDGEESEEDEEEAAEEVEGMEEEVGKVSTAGATRFRR
jgi:hypothetical protein